jgi:hypothetical protein
MNEGINTNDANNFSNEICLQYPTTHLRGFDDLLRSTRLIGDGYIPIMKSIWYNLVSTKIATSRLKIGDIYVDGRIHPLIVLRSGGGKNEMKRVIKEVLNGIGKNYIEPTSYHPEQFVGKVKISKDKDGETYKPIPGHLSQDYLLIDEGKQLLTSNDPINSESRKYLRMGMDQYPNNEITKKSVDIDHDNALRYTPHCCIAVFIQPFTLEEHIVLDGDLRRFVVPYVEMKGYNEEKAYEERLRGSSKLIPNENFIEVIKSLREFEDFNITEDAKTTFNELFDLLSKRGETYSLKMSNYMEIVGYGNQNTFIKFSVIQALQDNTSILDSKHIELAFIDYAEILEHTYLFVENKVIGDLNYGESWNGAMDKDFRALNWLNIHGATSELESNVSIADYIDKLMKVFRVDKRQAQRKLKIHKEKEWVETKKGQHDSKLWLAFTPSPENLREVSDVRHAINLQNKYLEIMDKHGLNN